MSIRLPFTRLDDMTMRSHSNTWHYLASIIVSTVTYIPHWGQCAESHKHAADPTCQASEIISCSLGHLCARAAFLEPEH